MREAIALCFDFEWTNRNLFYGAYKRSQSNFERSAYKAEGKPSAAELALLEPLRGKVPDTVFGEAPTLPASDGSGRDRKLLKQALDMLAVGRLEAQRRHAARTRQVQRLSLEILVEDEAFVRIDSPFVDNMRAIGIDATIRMVDSAQFQARRTDFDFDMMGIALSLAATPTRSELANMFAFERRRRAGLQQSARHRGRGGRRDDRRRRARRTAATN